MLFKQCINISSAFES